MKKLLLILLCIPMIGIGQGCQYGSSTDASELCDFYKGNNFATYRNADIALDKILDVTGMSKRFVLKECNDISNCVATAYKGIRYILYDRGFMDAIATRTNSWSSMSILAHEIGHHVNGHSLDLIIYATESAEAPTLSESRQMELEADEYSGFVMYKLGASLSQAQEAIRLISTNDDDSYSTHPSKDKRLRAIERGYNKAKNKGSNNDYSSKSSILTAEEYFYKAYNNESDYQYKIDNYTKCLKIDTDCATAYNNRGNSYKVLLNYNDAIADYSSAIRIQPDYAFAYNNRGDAYQELGNYNDAISDYSKAISIDSGYANAYYNRGYAYQELGNYNDAIDDYSRAIRINPDDEYAYKSRGYTYNKLGNYNDAIADYSRAIRIDPDYTDAYFKRGHTYRDLGNYNDAIDDYSRAIRIEPDYTDAYFTRGITYSMLENYIDALADYSRAIRIDPDYTDAYNNRGIAYYMIGNYNNAIDDYSRGIRIDPDNEDLYYNRAIAKRISGLSYCSDYKRACDLGNDKGCKHYNEQCK